MAETTVERSDELRVSVRGLTPSDAIIHAERSLRDEGFIPSWLSAMKQSDGSWIVTITGKRTVDDSSDGEEHVARLEAEANHD